MLYQIFPYSSLHLLAAAVTAGEPRHVGAQRESREWEEHGNVNDEVVVFEKENVSRKN